MPMHHISCKKIALKGICNYSALCLRVYGVIRIIDGSF